MGGLEEEVFAALAHDEEHGSREQEQRGIREGPVFEEAGVPVPWLAC